MSEQRSLFGTDGIRGTANQYPMTCEVALALGRAVAHQARAGEYRHRIVVGKDTRLSGYMLEMAFASGVCSMGVDAILVGPMPTPAIAYLTQTMRADAGVMISASHNPYEDNGFKIFARDGFKLPDAKEAELESMMQDEGVERIRPTRELVGKAFRIDDAMGRYISHLKTGFPGEFDLVGLTVVIDCAHGAAYKVAPTVLQELGAKVHALGVSPNGRNINYECGALHPASLQQAVLEYRADIGIALDGDADRLVVVDEKGQTINGDSVLALGARELMDAGTLEGNTLVTTVMSSMALDRYMASRGGNVVRTPVGDRYVVDKMRQGGFSFGGEQSGHLVYLEHGTTGDGMLAGLKLLANMRRRQTSLSEMAGELTPYPQHLENIRVHKKEPIQTLPTVQDAIRRVEERLGRDGRVLVRFSGTEPKARVLVEGPEQQMVTDMAKEIASVMADALKG